MNPLTQLEANLAAVLKTATPDDPACMVAGSAARHGVHAQCCKAVANMLAGRRETFDREAFLKACGITERRAP